MTQQRFALKWDRPTLAGALTHVTLFDGGDDPQHVIASGHGAGEREALTDLLTALREIHGSADATGFVSEAYAALLDRVGAGSRY